MKNKKVLIYIGIPILLIAVLAILYFSFSSGDQWKFTEDRPIKIFYLNSFHSENFPLTEDNIAAFRKVLEDDGVDFEIKQFDMNILRDPSEENKESSAQKAKEMIDEYRPDLLYATDDAAQELVAVDYTNTKMPIVFSGVNEDPETYGYDKAKNVAGVLERVHFVETVNFLKYIYPDVKKIGVIGSNYYLWEMVVERMKKTQEEIPYIEFTGWDLFPIYEDYQDKILDYQDKVDALIILGLVGIKDRQGKTVTTDIFSKWTVENSKLPEATFWNFHVAEGSLLSVDVSATEQGKEAAMLAEGILIDGKKPSSFEFKPSTIGEKNINLKRAESLGLKREDIPDVVLSTSKIYENYSWETE